MTVCSNAVISVVIGLLFLTSCVCVSASACVCVCVCVFRLWYIFCSVILGVTFCITIICLMKRKLKDMLHFPLVLMNRLNKTESVVL